MYFGRRYFQTGEIPVSDKTFNPSIYLYLYALVFACQWVIIHSYQYMFLYSNCSQVGQWESLQVGFCISFWHIPHLWILCYFLIQDVWALKLTLPAPAPQSVISLGALHFVIYLFFKWKTVFRGQGLGTRCSLCYQDVIAARLHSVDKARKYMYVYAAYLPHTHEH